MDGDLLGNIMIFVLAGTTVTQPVVNIIRTQIQMPGWCPPALALFIGLLSVILLMLANNIGITTQTGAQAGLSALLIMPAAVGITTLQRKADEATQIRAYAYGAR